MTIRKLTITYVAPVPSLLDSAGFSGSQEPRRVQGSLKSKQGPFHSMSGYCGPLGPHHKELELGCVKAIPLR